jgi:curved DNA-binding protein CbpA
MSEQMENDPKAKQENDLKLKQQQAKREQEEAQEQINALLNQTRPKNLGEGLKSGVGNILGGALGAIGVAVVAPVAGGAMGLRGGGILGGVVGVAGGAVVGVVGAAAMVVGGAGMGIVQIVRGVGAQPEAMMAPKRGKWWDTNEGKWVYTDLKKEEESMVDVPEDDSDLLKDIAEEIDMRASTAGGEVLDMYYYDVLEVDARAEPSAIKRKYYVLARKYHPDKVGADDKEAANKFKEVAEAYQVLSDPELRKQYDKEGRKGLSADKTEVAQDVPKIDAAILFAFLFGSDKFHDYVGRLATATAMEVGDSPKVSKETARVIQKRRVTRLAIKLAEKLQGWVDQDYDMSKTCWETEAAELAKASFGFEMVTTIGKIYNLTAHQFLGSLDSGIGMPSIAKWAEKNKAAVAMSNDARKNKLDTLRAGLEAMKIQGELEKELSEAKTEEEKAAVTAKMEEATGATMLKVLWFTTVVDITTTLHETCQMVLHDQAVDKESRERRGHGLKALGEIWMKCPEPENMSQAEKSAKTLYEDAAYNAMLETIARNEAATHKDTA